MEKLDYDKIILLATKAKECRQKADKAHSELISMFSNNTPDTNRKDTTQVLILNKPVRLDLYNLKDKALCKRDKSGSYKTEDGEQHFAFDNAQLAAEKQGKRLLTKEEFGFVSKLPRRWDDKKKGFWFTFDRVSGGTVDIFFPASGYRGGVDGALYDVGSDGYYWSCSVSGASRAYSLYFYSSNGDRANSGGRACGQSVRCVSVNSKTERENEDRINRCRRS
jgi:hypothetical protein